MLMLCYFYCIPLAKFLFFALGPFIFLVSMFALKRGIRQAKRHLRQRAIMFMFIAAVKVFLVDVYILRKEILCGYELPILSCNFSSYIKLQVLALLLLVGVSCILFQVYRIYYADTKIRLLPQEKTYARLAANMTMISIIFMTVWVAAPWVGSLLTGKLPAFFKIISWQTLAKINTGLILYGFWKCEECDWGNTVNRQGKAGKPKYGRPYKLWTPRDTLWLGVILFLIVLGLAYVSMDVLSGKTKAT